MAVKYRIPFRDLGNKEYKVEISLDDYVGDPINIRAVSGGVSLIYNGNSDDPLTTFITSNLNLNVYYQGEIDLEELQIADDREFIMEVYDSDGLYWRGFILSDGLQRPYVGGVQSVQLIATCGLSLLEGIDGRTPNTTATGTHNRSPVNYFRDLLWVRLGNELPIRFIVDGLECEYYPDENVAVGTGVKWSPRGEGMQNENGDYVNVRYILENMAMSWASRVYQSNGMWVVERLPDVFTGSYNAKDVSGITVTDVSVNALKTIGNGGYPFIQEDAYLTIKKPFKKIEVTYNQAQNSNALPNGNMDKIDGTAARPLYWGKDSESGFLSTYQSLNLRTGSALHIQNNGIFAEEDIYVSIYDQGNEGLPIDSHTLFTTGEFGFTFLPLAGYPLMPDGETIDFSSNPFKVQIRYTVDYSGGTRDYYLNEFGYWQYEPRGTSLGTSFSYQTQVNNPGTNPYSDNRMYFTGNPSIGDVISIGIIRNRYGNVRDYYSVTCEAAEEGNLQLFLQKMLDELPGSTGGWDLFNRQVNMADTLNGHIRYSIVVGYGQPDVSTYKSDALQDYQHISIDVEQLKIGDVARVQIQSKANEGKILIPDAGNLDTTTDDYIGRLFIKFLVLQGQDLALGDVYVNLNSNSDVYSAAIPGLPENTAVESRSLAISSSFSGFFNSNYMSGWSSSNMEFRFVNVAGDVGSLTRLYAIDVMRMFSVPRTIFNGSINVRNDKWGFGEVYEIEGMESKKFVPLSATYNMDRAEVQLSAIEVGYDTGLLLDVKHYGSDNEPQTV